MLILRQTWFSGNECPQGTGGITRLGVQGLWPQLSGSVLLPEGF